MHLPPSSVCQHGVGCGSWQHAAEVRARGVRRGLAAADGAAHHGGARAGRLLQRAPRAPRQAAHPVLDAFEPRRECPGTVHTSKKATAGLSDYKRRLIRIVCAMTLQKPLRNDLCHDVLQ